MMKIVSINFDLKTKIIMGISVVIAICIIIYNFFNICIRKDEIFENELDFSKILSFEAESEIKVNSNKNTNIYKIQEMSNIEEGNYKYSIDNELKIDISVNEIKISNCNSSYEYLISNEYISNYNYVSIASIIKLFNDINSKIIEGKIVQVTQDNELIYKLYFEGEKVNYIEIYLRDNKISEIKIFEDGENELYYIKIESFIVKKSN